MPNFTGKVLLLGNYAPDQQQSMQHFAQMLLGGLIARNVAVELIRPEPVMGRFGRSKWLGYFDKLILFPRRLKKHLRSLNAGDLLHICDHSNAVYTKNAQRVPHLVT